MLALEEALQTEPLPVCEIRASRGSSLSSERVSRPSLPLHTLAIVTRPLPCCCCALCTRRCTRAPSPTRPARHSSLAHSLSRHITTAAARHIMRLLCTASLPRHSSVVLRLPSGQQSRWQRRHSAHRSLARLLVGCVCVVCCVLRNPSEHKSAVRETGHSTPLKGAAQKHSTSDARPSDGDLLLRAGLASSSPLQRRQDLEAAANNMSTEEGGDSAPELAMDAAAPGVRAGILEMAAATAAAQRDPNLPHPEKRALPPSPDPSNSSPLQLRLSTV